MIVIDGAGIVRAEPAPHGRIGTSTAWRYTAGIPGRRMEFLKRELHPGAAIGAHVLEHDEVYHVLSGTGEVHADGATAPLTAGMTAYLRTGQDVGIRQVGAMPLLLIISWPLAQPAD
jgi:mannose-6-phosphate isomerase-like protein (cupin superfamily)